MKIHGHLRRSGKVGIALALVATACSTSINDGSVPSYGKSTFVTTSGATILALANDATNVYWVDSDGQLSSCSKTGCNGKPTVLSTAYASNGRPAIAVANGAIYWFGPMRAGSTSGAPPLYSCPIAGCPAGPTITMLAAAANNIGNQLVGDASGLYFTDGMTIYRCKTADCGSGPTDVLAALRPNACNAGNGTCSCVSDQDCNFTAGKAPACVWATKTCVQCTATNQGSCAMMGLACDTTTNKCAKCNGDAGMATSAACDASNGNGGYFCGASGACGRCQQNADCTTGTHAGPVCDTNFGICGTACQNDTQCMPTQVCTSMSMGQTGVCAPKLRNGSNCGSARARACASGVCDTDMGGVCGTRNGGACTTDAACRGGACGSDGMCGLLNGQPCTSSDACRASYCGFDGKCGKPDGVQCGQPSECRSNKCNGSCGMFGGAGLSLALTSGFAVVDGRIFLVVNAGGGSSVISCAADACSLETVTVHLQASANATTARIVGADAKSVYLSDGASLRRCDLPTCDANLVTLGPSHGDTSGPTLLTSASLYVPQNMHGGDGAGGSTTPYGRCLRSGCPDGPVESSPDPTLDTGVLGAVDFSCSNCGVQSVRPFTVDATNVYWATSTIFGAEGNQIVTTPE